MATLKQTAITEALNKLGEARDNQTRRDILSELYEAGHSNGYEQAMSEFDQEQEGQPS